ncbi:LytTR family transcriptional regulator DNA-binding domain-containing protein [Paenibacillus cisolokensis]|uniref:HTH LytTR-type domain-containing protein n=1 Tax=Paenibacillus cisolokensis TaxID=1658519 RepID=A0ABQ4N9C2_9BACL|nr:MULTISPECIES: LytTR family transcriptional regulator DNA-binding domain-containing protein [Paenibacillus]ALS29800.1 LytTr DNA-binding domain-containing protein [Paenibacillus sp. 32O-W]GIQ64548.1 hypothetical protein PACILC2_31160 [Paenibacillus cisolokensis]
MNAAERERNVYEEFDVVRDILYFRVGAHHLVSFHGRNYNIKRRMSADQIRKLTADAHFFKVSSDCYVNLGKVDAIRDGIVVFRVPGADGKQIVISRRKRNQLQTLLQNRNQGTAS